MSIEQTIPDPDKIQRRREEIKELYKRIDMEQQFQEHKMEAIEEVMEAGVNPSKPLGEHKVNQLLEQKLQQMVQDIRQTVTEVETEVQSGTE